jgi:hypothetical protein
MPKTQFNMPLELPLIRVAIGLLDSGSTSSDVEEPTKSYIYVIAG